MGGDSESKKRKNAIASFFTAVGANALGNVLGLAVIGLVGATGVLVGHAVGNSDVKLNTEKAMAGSIEDVEAIDGGSDLNASARVLGHVKNVPAGFELRLIVRAAGDRYFVNPTVVSPNDDGSWAEETTLGDRDQGNLPLKFEIYLAISGEGELARVQEDGLDGLTKLPDTIAILDEVDRVRKRQGGNA